jgi:replication-associated recombination protein RarA
MLIKNPTSLATFAFPNKVAETEIKEIVQHSKDFHNGGKSGIILHSVGNGTGKTTCALMLPNAMEANRSGMPADRRIEYCQPPHNGVALLTGVSVTVHHQALGCGTHYIVLDEVDVLTKSAMQRLRSLLQKTGENAVFIMTTNNLADVEQSVVSRSHVIDFTPSSPTVWVDALRQMLISCGVTDPALLTKQSIVNNVLGQGCDMRKAITNVQKIARLFTAEQGLIT